MHSHNVFSALPIAQRMRWILDSNRVENASVWAMAAGLSRTYVTSFLERARKGKAGDIGLASLTALAEVAHVHPAWLAHGVGRPEDEISSLLPENLRTVVGRLPPKHYPESLLFQALAILDMLGEKDLPPEIWQDYLDGLRKETRRVGLELAAARLEGRGFKR